MNTGTHKFSARDRVHPQVPTTADGCPGLLQGPWPSGNLASHL